MACSHCSWRRSRCSFARPARSRTGSSSGHGRCRNSGPSMASPTARTRGSSSARHPQATIGFRTSSPAPRSRRSQTAPCWSRCRISSQARRSAIWCWVGASFSAAGSRTGPSAGALRPAQVRSRTASSIRVPAASSSTAEPRRQARTVEPTTRSSSTSLARLGATRSLVACSAPLIAGISPAGPIPPRPSSGSSTPGAPPACSSFPSRSRPTNRSIPRTRLPQAGITAR
jgi:hypothetical protein